MNSRNKIKAMLICILESELKNHFRAKGFNGKQIEAVIYRERSIDRFQNDAEDLLKDLEKDFFNESINSVFDELKKDNFQVKELLLEKRKLIGEIRTLLEIDFRAFKNAYDTNTVSNTSIQLEYLEIELNTLEKQKEEIAKIAERKASYISWIFLLFSFIALGIWIILIYFVFDWNFIEPITWIFGIALVAASNMIYAVFGRRITPESLKEKRIEAIKYQLYGLHCFNEKKCTFLCKEIESKKKYLRGVTSANKGVTASGA